MKIKKFTDKYDNRKIFYHVEFFGVKFRVAVKKNRAFKAGSNKRKYFSYLPKSIYYTDMGISYDGKNLYTLYRR